MSEPVDASLKRSVVVFFVLAHAITWGVQAPYVIACIRGDEDAMTWMNIGGFGALGPSLAALIVAKRLGVVRDAFGRWRASPTWVVVAVAIVPLLHVPASLLYAAFVHEPAQWFYPPNNAQTIVALVFFSVGEEFGWRGFAHPRLSRWLGPVRGSLWLGFFWATWHLFMMFTPDGPWPDMGLFAYQTVYLLAGAVIYAWVFERGGRSMLVALALHAGAHLDNIMRGPTSEVGLWALRLVFMIVAAILFARSLSRTPEGPTT